MFLSPVSSRLSTRYKQSYGPLPVIAFRDATRDCAVTPLSGTVDYDFWVEILLCMSAAECTPPPVPQIPGQEAEAPPGVMALRRSKRRRVA